MRPAECSGEGPPSRPRIPCVYGLEVGVGGGLGCWEYVSRSLFRALRERRVTLERMENVIVGLTGPFCCFVALPRKVRYFRKGGQLGRTAALSRTYFWSVSPTINYPWHTCVKTCSCYTCNCCFRAGWNSPLAVNRAVPKGCRGAGEASATEPMSPRPVCALVRMPAELVRFQCQRLESG